MKEFLKINRLNLILLTLLTIAVFFNSLGNAFLSDDLPEIVNNPNIGNLGYVISHNPFGFIRQIFYWIAFQIGGLNQVIFRSINILFHLGNIYLVYTLILLLIANRKIAFFASAIFAIHPLLVEPIIWISGGGYPQYSFFFLFSLLFYIKSKNNIKFYFISLITYFLSFMSHPVMPSSLLLIYPLYEFIFGNLRKNWLKIIPFALILFAYIFVNLSSLPEREQTLQSVHYQESGVDNIFILVPVAISSYLDLIFWPKDLTLYHSELALSIVGFSFSVIKLLVLFSLLIFFFKKNRKIFFWLSIFLISLLPTLTPLRLNWIVAERYAYFGSIGIFVTFVYILDKFLSAKYKSLFYIILTLIIVLLSARTILRNIDWKNEDNLWIATGKTSPSSPNTHNNLGDVYGRQGDKDRSLAEFKKAIEIKPNYADAYHNAGNVYHEMGKDAEAISSYQLAIKYNPNLWQSYQNIAAIYFINKQYDKALENVQKAIRINPKNLQLRINLGIIFLTTGQKEKAKEVFQQVLSADPQNQIALQALNEANK